MVLEQQGHFPANMWTMESGFMDLRSHRSFTLKRVLQRSTSSSCRSWLVFRASWIQCDNFPRPAPNSTKHRPPSRRPRSCRCPKIEDCKHLTGQVRPCLRWFQVSQGGSGSVVFLPYLLFQVFVGGVSILWVAEFYLEDRVGQDTVLHITIQP